MKLAGCVLAACWLLASPRLSAQTCESGRPSDAGEGAQGIKYRTSELAYLDSPSARARVHYALSGTDAPPSKSTLMDGVPDVIVVAAQAADAALDEFERLGYDAPLGDGDSPCASSGDSDAVDIYVLDFSAADGQAMLDHCEGGSPKRCAGFVLVENDFRGGSYADAAEGMRTVVPHELFHLVQDGYDSGLERWWAEGSAQWAAKHVYPELPDLERFLPAYFEAPWRPLNAPPTGVVASFLYATAIWPVFLEQRYDAALIHEVFAGERGGVKDVMAATDAALGARGSSLAAAFLEFASYNAATGARAPLSGGYAQASSYPLIDIEQTLSASAGVSVSGVMAGFGAYYYALHVDAPLRLSLEADATRVAAMLVPLVDGRAALDAAKPLPALLDGDGIVVVAGQSGARTDAPFSVHVESGPTGAGDDAPESSGCAVAGPGRAGGAIPGALLGFVVSLLGRARLRARRQNRRKDS